MGIFGNWQRSSFWLQYGRLRQHLQACDVLLEQINACAALPGRPKLEFPPGISREGRIIKQHCEISCCATPQSPFDAALNLSFEYTPRADCGNNQVYCPDRLLPLSDPQIRPEECSSLADKNSQPQSSVSLLLKSESQVFSLASPSSHDSGSGKDACACPDNNAFNDDPEFCNNSIDSDSELKPLHHTSPPVACISGNDDRVSECCGSSAPDLVVVVVPENPPQQFRPINFISASYYVERPSNTHPFSPSNTNTTRRTSFCRIEAFVIRSKSVKSMPPQRHIGIPESKK